MLVLAALTASLQAFTPLGWSRLRSATAIAVSRSGSAILYEVAHGVDKGPSAHEWWTIAPSGKSAKQMRVPKGFSPEGFLKDDGLFGTYAKGEEPAQLATYDLNKLRVLTHLPMGVSEVTIAPDGSHFATLASNEPKDPLDNVRVVVTNPVSTPYVINLDGTGGVWWCPAITDAANIAWSPDGRSLAVLTQVPKIGYHDVRGTVDVCRPNRVTRVATVPNAASSIAWINNGATIAFLSTATPTLTPEHVYTVPASGGKPVDRTPDLAGTAMNLVADAQGDGWVVVMRGVQGEIDRFAHGTLLPAYHYGDGTIFGVQFSPFAVS